jgi:hypothetical protein
MSAKTAIETPIIANVFVDASRMANNNNGTIIDKTI